uniref:DB domain-containing protein n=1 Tax=Globodera pallida TaxID=36090 RepID=A0A183BSA0_GLOPA
MATVCGMFIFLLICALTVTQSIAYGRSKRNNQTPSSSNSSSFWVQKSTDQLIGEANAKGKCKSKMYCVCGYVTKKRHRLSGLCCYKSVDNCQCCDTDSSIPKLPPAVIDLLDTKACHAEMDEIDGAGHKCVWKHGTSASVCCDKHYELGSFVIHPAYDAMAHFPKTITAMLCESSWNPVCPPFSETWDTDHVADCAAFNQCASEWYWSPPTKKRHRPNAAGARLPVSVVIVLMPLIMQSVSARI